MAIDDAQEKSNPTAELNRRYCNIAGAGSAVLGQLGVARLRDAFAVDRPSVRRVGADLLISGSVVRGLDARRSGSAT